MNQNIFSTLTFFGFLPGVKKALLQNAKAYFVNTCISELINEMPDEEAYEKIIISQKFILANAFNSKHFTDSLLDLFFQKNAYILTAKDIAVAINLSLRVYNNQNVKLEARIIDAAFTIENLLATSAMYDANMRYILEALGKSEAVSIKPNRSRAEIEDIFSIEESVFTSYYQVFNSNYTPAIVAEQVVA
jgi:hypothetical protein